MEEAFCWNKFLKKESLATESKSTISLSHLGVQSTYYNTWVFPLLSMTYKTQKPDEDKVSLGSYKILKVHLGFK